MKSFSKFLIATLILSGLFSITSCDDDDSPVNEDNTTDREPLLSSIIFTTDDEGAPRKYSYSYDEEGNLTSVIMDIISSENLDYKVRFDSIVYIDDKISEIHGVAENNGVDIKVFYTYEEEKTTIDFIATPDQEKNTRVILEYDDQNRLISYSNEPIPQGDEPFVDQYYIEYMENDMSMMYFIEEGDTIKQYQKYSYEVKNPMNIYTFLTPEFYDGMFPIIFANSGLVTEFYQSEEDYLNNVKGKFEYSPTTKGYPSEIKIIQPDGRDFISWYYTYK
jgi:YD repeat-containing protein